MRVARALCLGAFFVIPEDGRRAGAMIRSVHLFAAALVGAALVSSADAQTPASDTPSLHSGASRHVPKRHAEPQADRHATVHKNADATPSWLTLGQDRSTGRRGNYATSSFDQPSAVEGTFSDYRGRARVDSRYGAPGAPLLNF
jgi:hypothetical protein